MRPTRRRREVLEYWWSPQAQKYFAEGNSEYSGGCGVELSAELKSLGTFKEDSSTPVCSHRTTPRR